MKRITSAFLALTLILLAYPPQSADAKTSLIEAMAIRTEASQVGDVTITWDPSALQSLRDVDIRIGYTYDLIDEPRVLRPRRVDPRAGFASFTNLSLNSTYKFEVLIRAKTVLVASTKIVVVTPKPARKFVGNSSVKAQLAYIDTHWLTRENSRYAYVPNNDCANFVSQTLVARGLKQTKLWNQSKKVATPPFVFATALRTYLLKLKGFKELPDSQREKVKIGDIAMFDWNNSGDKDHVGIVNLIQKMPDGSIKIYIAQHTLHRYYRSVDWFITVRHPNAKVSYMSVPEVLYSIN